MLIPIGGGRTGPERILQAAVETLHETISLGMVGGGLDMGD
jgi:hypothetical protein